MNAYTEYPQCAKCGSVSPATKHVPRVTSWLVEIEEHLELTCPRCEYKWQQRTRDYQAPGPAQKRPPADDWESDPHNPAN